MLVCPTTKQPVRIVDLSVLPLDLQPAVRMKGGKTLASRVPEYAASVMIRSDGLAAYPVMGDVPIMLAPEMLSIGVSPPAINLDDPKYAEAYAERDFYDSAATDSVRDLTTSESYHFVRRVHASDEARHTFPNPRAVWLDAPYDSVAQWRAYQHIAPLDGKDVLQVGGSGSAAVSFLLGGADAAWLLTPMPAEAIMAEALAKSVGVGAQLHCVVGVAEELPFETASFDVVYAGGCIHHTVTSVALPEISRVLRPGGRFAAFDPWRAPLYEFGTRLLGKREPQVSCQPLTAARVRPLRAAFEQSSVSLYGALTRYPLLALWKAGFSVPLMTAFRIMCFDERLSARFRVLRRYGSSVALLATK
jgi:ubiquinone/menaquinone biosynthesis C-methylase UbiE/uncharacterized protein YbaR (Trm112 family)